MEVPGGVTGSWWIGAKSVVVIDIAVLVEYFASEMELVDGDDVLVG